MKSLKLGIYLYNMWEIFNNRKGTITITLPFNIAPAPNIGLLLLGNIDSILDWTSSRYDTMPKSVDVYVALNKSMLSSDAVFLLTGKSLMGIRDRRKYLV